MGPMYATIKERGVTDFQGRVKTTSKSKRAPALGDCSTQPHHVSPPACAGHAPSTRRNITIWPT